MGYTRQVIALCSVGNLGKYVCDELIADGRYDFVVITRQKLQLKPDDFFESRKIDRRACDYSTEAVRRTLNETNASVFISFNNADGQQFVDLHCAWLEACRQSKNCKRFIPSEFAGNIEDFPMLPRHYATSRAPFRTILESERKIEWTIVNNAWFMDYLLRDEKTFLPTNSHEFPINPNDWTALIRGSGDEIQSFTSARDVAKALVALLSAPTWPSKTIIAGQWASFNELCHIMEDFYGRKLTKFYRSESDIERDNALPATPENMEKLYMASVEEMMITKAGAMPRDIVARQRKELFGNVHFDSVTEFLVAVGEERARPASLL